MSNQSLNNLKQAFAAITSERMTPEVELIKKGEFVRRISASGIPQSKTYKRGDYDRASKRYSLVDCDDVCREVFVKRGTKLLIGFDY
jgi:hypothetical protein